MKKTILTLSLLGFFSTQILCAKSNTQIIGDVLAGGIPLVAYGTTLYTDDNEGQMQFYKSYGTNFLSTALLKYTIREKRPNSEEKDSFPSFHTSSAFSGATFIHKRYGLEYAIPAYIGAIYTGYSRVQSNQHHTQDVIAGTVLGMASSWYFTTSYEGIQIEPLLSTQFNGIKLSYKF